MGLFDKFFGKNSGFADMKPRAVRIGGSIIKDIFFEFQPEERWTKVQIANLSVTGLLLMGGDFEVGEEFKGRVGFQGNQLDIEIKIVRQDSYMYGARVTSPQPEYFDYMTNIFEVELAAADASPVPANQLKGVEGGDPVWLISRKGQSIFLLLNGEKITNYAIYTGQYLIERRLIGVDNAFKIYQIEGEYEDPINFEGSPVLVEDAPNEETYGIAKKFIMAVKGLSDEQRMEIDIDLYRLFKPKTD